MSRNDALRAAERKIAEALENRARDLDLSVPFSGEPAALRDLPISLRQLTRLEELDLSGLGLTALPGWLAELQALTTLNLSNNQFRTLPEVVRRLRQLERLEASGNPLQALPPWLGELGALRLLNFSRTYITELPDSFERLQHLESLYLGYLPLTKFPTPLRALGGLENLQIWSTDLTEVPSWIGELQNLKYLGLDHNKLTSVPESIGQLQNLQSLELDGAALGALPEWIAGLTSLSTLRLTNCGITDLPPALADLPLAELTLGGNPLNPELAAAYAEGLDAVKRYLLLKRDAKVVLNEAKLIVIGEGEVGKSCLLGALRGDPWEEGRPTTHGIEIKPVTVTDPETDREITLNGWDFGGQRVYRPTHQLFFSAPAVYLAVWKPREGPQQGFVKEWIKLVKHREPEAKILIVATHGGPKERQPDIDRQEIWDLFGRDMVLDFFLVDSKDRSGIAGLKAAIARVAATLPEMGRSVPRRWQQTWQALKGTGDAYLPLDVVLQLCADHGMDPDEAGDFVRISHRLGHLIHYQHDPLLRDIVVLKPDWLATAISFVLDDRQTRDNHGLVTFARLGELWDDPDRPHARYPPQLHPVFLRLMERFDLSYRVAGASDSDGDAVSLIAQLVPDIRPDLNASWPAQPAAGDEEQVQICRIVDNQKRQSANAEGLFFQLIVRLHKYSLGRENYPDSVHWQRGLVVEDDYGSRALLEHIGNDVRITVRSPYPERFLSALTYEVKWLVENFWAGLRCDVMVPCLNPQPCIGLFEVSKLLENKRRGRPEQPCPICNDWQSIEMLLHNAPAARPNPLNELLANSDQILRRLTEVRVHLATRDEQMLGRFDRLDTGARELVNKVDAGFASLMRAFTDEAKEGPRLFSFHPVDPGFFDRPKWVSEKFRVTLWCEHSRLPLPVLYGAGDRRGSYELTLPREWLVKAAPFLKILAGTLSLVVPVASSATKLMLDDNAYKNIEEQLDLGQKSLDTVIKGGEKAGTWIGQDDDLELTRGDAIVARGSILRQLHAWLKEKDPGFGGLVRVQNKRQEYLWVHPRFESQY